MPSVLEPPRRRANRRHGQPSAGWWGTGPSPLERWPGVTIAIDSQWSSLRRRWESSDRRYFYDAKEAKRACDFFPTYLKHHIGEWVGQRFDLMDYQRDLLVRPLFGWKRVEDGMRRFRKLFAFIPKGGGKALALDTPIPTPSGWTTMGDVVAGDEIFDELGRVSKVLSTSEVMIGAVKAHLARHYRQFDETPPWEAQAQAETLDDIDIALALAERA